MSEDDYQDCWVTVFGLPPATSYILEQFSQYMTILKPCGVWVWLVQWLSAYHHYIPSLLGFHLGGC